MGASAHIFDESNWHEPGFAYEREASRRARQNKAWLRRRASELYIDERREDEDAATRRFDRNHPKPKGCPERAGPKIFSEAGELAETVASRISGQQQSVAESLFHEHGLKSKAGRAGSCRVFARRVDCIENETHRFFTLFRCGLRYCPGGCGKRSFAELFHKHMRLAKIIATVGERVRYEREVSRQARHNRAITVIRNRNDTRNGRNQKYSAKRVRSWRRWRGGSMVVAKLDFTSKKKAVMPSPAEVRRFNEDIRRFFRLVEKEFGISRKAYGCLWCDEFGSGNTNLHAHSVYVGPFLKQKILSRLWARVRADGSFIVSIKVARSFELALAHCLKYPSKFFDAPGRRLASLEKAFHRVRRVHAIAAFYNPKVEREPGEDGGPLDGGCPVCKAPLGETFSTKRGWDFADRCAREGRIDIEEARTASRRAAALNLSECPFAQPEDFPAVLPP